MFAKELGSIGFIACAAGAISFIVTYSLVAPWWRTPTGRNLWAFSASVSLIMLLSAYRLAFGQLPGWDYVRAVCYMFLAVAIWSAEVALVRVQILRRRATKSKPKMSQDSDA